jgi:pimeloyl-ACP methyl ester carboxylesterase
MGGPGDPADLELTGEEVTFNLADGSASPGWIVAGDLKDAPPEAQENLPDAQGKFPGGVAVVVHGHRDSRFGGLYRAQMLRPYVAYTVVFDLPGHGDAEATSCKMGGREVEDLAAVLAGLPPEVLEVAGKRRPVVLLGYSMGAVIATRAAAAWAKAAGDAPRVDGVIACAPYRFWDQGLRGQMVRRGLPTWPTVALTGALLRAAAGWGRGGLGVKPGFDLAEEAKRIDAPLLVLHGDADTICPLAAGRAVADAAPRGTLAVIHGGTHNQLLGADHDAVHAALRRFFAGLGPTA